MTTRLLAAIQWDALAREQQEMAAHLRSLPKADEGGAALCLRRAQTYRETAEDLRRAKEPTGRVWTAAGWQDRYA